MKVILSGESNIIVSLGLTTTAPNISTFNSVPELGVLKVIGASLSVVKISRRVLFSVPID